MQSVPDDVEQLEPLELVDVPTLDFDELELIEVGRGLEYTKVGLLAAIAIELGLLLRRMSA